MGLLANATYFDELDEVATIKKISDIKKRTRRRVSLNQQTDYFAFATTLRCGNFSRIRAALPAKSRK
jgi:hypothetical protein